MYIPTEISFGIDMVNTEKYQPIPTGKYRFDTTLVITPRREKINRFGNCRGGIFLRNEHFKKHILGTQKGFHVAIHST
jgi:hypothetical protein